MWSYYARVDRVVDGDTIDLIVDLGFGTYRAERFRLYGVDTPEVYGPRKSEEGKAASEFVKGLLPDKHKVIVETVKGKGKYGRYLATIWHQGKENPSLNEVLITEGHAKPYDGGKR